MIHSSTPTTLKPSSLRPVPWMEMVYVYLFPADHSPPSVMVSSFISLPSTTTVKVAAVTFAVPGGMVRRN